MNEYRVKATIYTFKEGREILLDRVTMSVDDFVEYAKQKYARPKKTLRKIPNVFMIAGQAMEELSKGDEE